MTEGDKLDRILAWVMGKELSLKGAHHKISNLEEQVEDLKVLLGKAEHFRAYWKREAESKVEESGV